MTPSLRRASLFAALAMPVRAEDFSLYASPDPLSRTVLTGSLKSEGQPWVTVRRVDPAASGRPGLPLIAVQGVDLSSDLKDSPGPARRDLVLPASAVPPQPALPTAAFPEKKKKQSPPLHRPPRGGDATWSPRAAEQLRIMSGGKVRVSFYDPPPRRP